jgi:hypothetical protein
VVVATLRSDDRRRYHEIVDRRRHREIVLRKHERYSALRLGAAGRRHALDSNVNADSEEIANADEEAGVAPRR